VASKKHVVDVVCNGNTLVVKVDESRLMVYVRGRSTEIIRFDNAKKEDVLKYIKKKYGEAVAKCTDEVLG